ncbi:Gfo/Idh/MocA family oxidoreductase [Spirulina sp. CS-785/01]|uniref:Gfo/Idh/MocA family protein n=1 Tax=Spirulina sp. CS-785/01 TaxID=3021716 RepID=UPI00232B6F3A|nr:Gfo/Idh/MocA family oxidoreductase [Spirulina sp. CS-785/01]MDB9312001.1 Gfo/Idh/MocA family oxidoreductase [Spirulina sp. CS-785/01]
MKSLQAPVNIGIVGTGYAAQRRAEAFSENPRARVLAIAGHTPSTTQTLAQQHNAQAEESWEKLVRNPDLDLVVICTINRDHGKIARAALEAGKHVLCEYPLSLDSAEGNALLQFAQSQQKLLHVEHIEILGSLHQTLRDYLPKIGEVTYARYTTITPQTPVAGRWTYHYDYFGFPFAAALSRIHRFTHLFGEVSAVSGQARFWDSPAPHYYTACLCTAQLRFSQGLVADITYGKGEQFTHGGRTFEVYGTEGTLIFDTEGGRLIRHKEETPIQLGSRRGLFNADSQQVLDHLLDGKPLYIEPTSSLYALSVAHAVQQSARSGETIRL